MTPNTRGARSTISSTWFVMCTRHKPLGDQATLAWLNAKSQATMGKHQPKRMPARVYQVKTRRAAWARGACCGELGIRSFRRYAIVLAVAVGPTYLTPATVFHSTYWLGYLPPLGITRSPRDRWCSRGRPIPPHSNH